MASRSKQSRQIPSQLPRTIHELVMAGGPIALARAVAEAAARRELEFWLGVLEGINQDDLGEQDQKFCALYIRDLRRKLGIRIRHSQAEIREHMRLRRRFRGRAQSS